MAAYEIPNLRFSGEAGAAIARRRFVTVNADEQVVTANATSTVIGVSSQPNAKAGEVAEIYDGIVMVEAAAAIDAGSKVGSDANGKAIVATDLVAGVAITSAGAAGELISVKL